MRVSERKADEEEVEMIMENAIQFATLGPTKECSFDRCRKGR